MLKRRNDAVVDDTERLTSGELIISQQLACVIRGVGMEKATEIKMALRRESAVSSIGNP